MGPRMWAHGPRGVFSGFGMVFFMFLYSNIPKTVFSHGRAWFSSWFPIEIQPKPCFPMVWHAFLHVFLAQGQEIFDFLCPGDGILPL